MAVGGVDRAGDDARVQNIRAEEAQAQNERRRVQTENEQEARRPRETNRGQNTDVTA